MKNLLSFLALISLIIAVPVLQTGCQHQVTLEQAAAGAPPAAYTDASLATTDQAILDASHALSGFIDWYNANTTFLAKYPAIGALEARVVAQKDGWIRNAYAARDAYAEAAKAYKDGLASAPPDKAKLMAALAVLTDITSQVATYKAAHP